MLATLTAMFSVATFMYENSDIRARCAKFLNSYNVSCEVQLQFWMCLQMHCMEKYILQNVNHVCTVLEFPNPSNQPPICCSLQGYFVFRAWESQYFHFTIAMKPVNVGWVSCVVIEECETMLISGFSVVVVSVHLVSHVNSSDTRFHVAVEFQRHSKSGDIGISATL